MKKVYDIFYIILFFGMITVFIWGVGYCLDQEEQQVISGKKLPGTTILPVINHGEKGQR